MGLTCMDRVLITGANGFTGHYLCRLLSEQGYDVHGLVHSGQRSAVLPHAAATHAGDLLDGDFLRRLVSGIRPTHVVHLAAISFVEHGNAEEIYRTNLFGTRNLLEALAHADNRPEAVLVASSANVYGNRVSGQLSEDSPPEPVNDYAVSKLASEYLLGLYHNRLPIICVRPFNYTGVGQSEQFLIPKIVAHARRKAPLIALGNLDTARDFSDVRTVVAKYAKLLREPQAIGKTYNVCSGQAYSIREVLELVERQSGHHLHIDVDPSLVRTNEVQRLWGNPAKLASQIGMEAEIALEDTLEWMLQA